MPKTVDKRAQARRTARVQQAHQTTPEQAAARRAAAARKRGKQQSGIVGFIQRFPLATTLLVIAVVGGAVLLMSSLHLGPWYVPPCNLKTHVCQAEAAKAMTIDPTKSYTATIKTARGDIVIALDAKNSPKTVNNFVFLANQNWYNGTYFWRVETPGKPSVIDSSGAPSQLSLIQGGSVSDVGQDDKSIPGYTIPDELSAAKDGYGPGTVAMANTGQPNTGAAQFFIDIGDETSFFSKTYAVFGHVTSGMDVVKKIQPKDKITSITITQK